MSESLNIIISGYGKMGKAVENIALERHHNVIAKIDNDDDWKILPAELPGNSVIIDFSTPETAVDNILKSFNLNIPVVTGTTGWYDNLETIKTKCITGKGTMLYAPNFSISVNVLFFLNKKLARIMNNIEGYNVQINEIHHKHKLDAPSGTAIQLANDIIKRIDKYEKWVNTQNASEKELPVTSQRIGEVPGVHEIFYESKIDKITLKHEAKSRDGFALGAVLAAEFVYNKTGFFTLDDMLKTFGL